MVCRGEGCGAFRRGHRACPENALRSAHPRAAARDFASTNPRFAVEAGLAALHWIAAGYGYEIPGLDVPSAYSSTMDAAKNANTVDETIDRIRELLCTPTSPSKEFVAKVLERGLDVR